MLLNKQWITEEIKGEIKKIPRNKWKQKYNTPKSTQCIKRSSKREVNSNTGLSQETRSEIKNLTLHLDKLEKKNKQNPKLVKGRK